MAIDATGTPTSPDGIPTYNTAVDSPSGKGLNNIVAAVQSALSARLSAPAGIAIGEVPVWNGTTFVRSTTTNVGPTSLGTGTPDATKFLRGDGSWQVPSGLGLQAAASWNPANPASTTSGTAVMMGLGSTMTFTPNSTGRALLVVTSNKFQAVGTGSGVSAMQLRHGTGTAPTNGAAATGTLDLDLGAVTGPTVITWTKVVSGLTLATPVWVDLAVNTTNAGVATTQPTSIVAFALEL